MGAKTHYELLEIEPDAPADEIKKAFRRLIAMYHPDKVQHLGAEFQELALERASALTTAYKTLADPDRRAEYDRSLIVEPQPARRPTPYNHPAQPAQPPSPPPPPPSPEPAEAEERSTTPPSPEREEDGFGERSSASYASVRLDRDAVLRRAVLSRIDRVLAALCGDADRSRVPGFDLSYFSKPRFLGAARPWLVVKFVPRLDAWVMQEIWTQLVRAAVTRHVSVALFVLTAEIASEREIAEVIAGNRRRPDAKQRITVVPVDVRDWRAWVPKEADRTVRSVAERLRTAG